MTKTPSSVSGKFTRRRFLNSCVGCSACMAAMPLVTMNACTEQKRITYKLLRFGNTEAGQKTCRTISTTKQKGESVFQTFSRTESFNIKVKQTNCLRLSSSSYKLTVSHKLGLLIFNSKFSH